MLVDGTFWNILCQQTGQNKLWKAAGRGIALGHVAYSQDSTLGQPTVQGGHVTVGRTPAMHLATSDTTASAAEGIQGCFQARRSAPEASQQGPDPPAATPRVWSWSMIMKSSGACSSPSMRASLQGRGVGRAAEEVGHHVRGCVRRPQLPMRVN
jgi:hypothetical protein